VLRVHHQSYLDVREAPHLSRRTAHVIRHDEDTVTATADKVARVGLGQCHH